VDPLNHFVEAQDPVYSQVLQELAAGQKRSHWMWFMFPQLEGLGHSAMAQKYSIASLDEALDYLEHPILGLRLRECTELVLSHFDRSANAIFGSPDHLKFRSCMTLFSLAAPDETLFQRALDQFFDGQGDPVTIANVG
jgi:uncharacterized protein (DUF1810 family)